MDILTKSGEKLFNTLLNYEENDISKIIYYINTHKLIKSNISNIKIKNIDLNEYVNNILSYWSYKLSIFESNIIKNKSILTLYISKSNLSDYHKSILILICEIEFHKYNPVFNNFSIIPSLFNSKIPIYFGSCHIWSYLFMKYIILEKVHLTGIERILYVLLKIKNEKIYFNHNKSSLEIFNKVCKIKGKFYKSINLKQLKHKTGILFMSIIKFKDLNASILNNNICHSVCLNNSLIYDSNRYDISFDKFIEINKL